jgi:ribonuclease T1
MRWVVVALLAASSVALAVSGSVQLADLPPEVGATIARVRAGGPFPFARDGVVFSNRERQLPRRSRGYYREYTVKTPGTRDRGARRLVAGRGGEWYYTDDHYRTFRRIIDPASTDRALTHP